MSIDDLINKMALGIATVGISLYVLNPTFNDKGIQMKNTAYADEQVAFDTLKKGHELWMKRQYTEVIPILEAALAEYRITLTEFQKNNPNTPLPSVNFESNFATALSELSGSYLHSTVLAKVNNAPYPDSIKRLERAKELSDEAIERYHEAFSKYPEKKAKLRGYSGTFNIRGMIFKYLGNIEEARKNYEKAIELNPNNNDAKDNLRDIYNNKDLFLR